MEQLLKKTGSLNFKNTATQLYLKKGAPISKEYEKNEGKGVLVYIDTRDTDYAHSAERILPKVQERLRMVHAQDKED